MKQTSKERKADHTAQERARQAGYERMQKAPPVKTWSATMPAYCYTSLCPVAELREPIRREGGVIMSNLVNTHRKCRKCGKVYPAGSEQRYCEQDGGYLYLTGDCYHPKVGGDAVGKAKKN